MKYRVLGKSGLSISEIGLGTMSIHPENESMG
jgi:aryl-alcohol dehydrogenase-like predicted oxidoreductase